MGNLPNIAKELSSVIKHYIKHVEAMGKTGFAEEDAKEFVLNWLKVQMRLAWVFYHNEQR